MSNPYPDLPWSALAMDGRKVPWVELRTLAVAAIESDDVRCELIRRGTEKLDYTEGVGEREEPDLTVLGVVAVIAIGAERFSEPAKKDLTRQLMQWLNDAGEMNDDGLMEVIVETTGRLGPAILEPIMQIIEDNGTEMECWFHAFNLLDVAEHADPETQAAVIRFCRKQLRELFTQPNTDIILAGPAGVLNDLRHTDSLPFLREIHSRTNNPDIADMIEQLEGKAERLSDDLVKSWLRPVEKWLPESWDSWRDWWKNELPDLLKEWEEDDDGFDDDFNEDEADDSEYEEESEESDEDEPPLKPIHDTAPHIGRNDPCPCGSGKKYKKCCGRHA